MSNERGKLYVVATPIGNLQDLSPRATKILGSVDLILAEDTRHSRRLLEYFSIKAPLSSYHKYNERQQLSRLLEKFRAGQHIALISDAGTPLISDPGLSLVIAAHDYGFPVVPVPGPSACISALSASGLPTYPFLFYGYLPAKQSMRLRVLESLADQTATLIFYEAPHRVRASLADATRILGGKRPAAIARELTKYYEEIHRSNLQDCLDWLDEKSERSKGEFVLLVGGGTEVDADEIAARQILELLLKEVPKNKAAELTAKITGMKKNDLYQMALAPHK